LYDAEITVLHMKCTPVLGKAAFSTLGCNWRCGGRRALGWSQLLNFEHLGQGQLKTGSLGKAVWPQLSQTDPLERTVIGRNLPSTTQYGQLSSVLVIVESNQAGQRFGSS